MGNIEDWLGVLETAMKKTVKDMCGKVAEVCKTIDLSSLLRDYTAQMAIIGVCLCPLLSTLRRCLGGAARRLKR